MRRLHSTVMVTATACTVFSAAGFTQQCQHMTHHKRNLYSLVKSGHANGGCLLVSVPCSLDSWWYVCALVDMKDDSLGFRSRRYRAGTPAHSCPEGMTVPAATTEPAATIEPFSICMHPQSACAWALHVVMHFTPLESQDLTPPGGVRQRWSRGRP